ncbi:hypothetical protein BVX97_03475 [bacterium E08(2017)]|nr:hypothetical protein BVX97_03475 [bacterium E08(2017)]
MKWVTCILIVLCCTGAFSEDLTVWHDRQALKDNNQPDWLRAFPIGNGSLGGMVYGNVAKDEVQLNLDTLYALEPDTACFIPNIKDSLPQVRKWLAAGEYKKAQDYVTRHWLGRSNAPYVTMGSLRLDCHKSSTGMSNYRKSLDLSTAVVTTEYELDGVKYRREYFSSYPDKALVVRMTADKPGMISAILRQTTPHTPTTAFKAKGNTLLMRGQAPGEAYRRDLDERAAPDGHKYPAFFEKDPNGKYQLKKHILAKRNKPGQHPENILYGDEVDGRGMFFASLLKVQTDSGSVRAKNDSLVVENADSLTIVLCADTSFNGQDKSPSRDGRDPVTSVKSLQNQIGAIDYEALRKRHTEDHEALFGRLDLSLGAVDESKLALPTDKRIEQYGRHSDPSLVALFYQFNRYLTIAGSRPGSQPLNLQGIWNNHIIPPWNGAYTVNINAEMNYWNVLRGNLAELHEPFLRSITECFPNGQEVAKEMYGLDGWCMHHNISIWRKCAPVDGSVQEGGRTSFWNMGAGWFLQHAWEHYLFTQDIDILKEHYPVMLEAARFYSQWLVDRGDGILWTPVGTSPENAFEIDDGPRVAVAPGPTMDIAIIRECYSNLLEAAGILDRKDPLLDTIRTQLPKLLPYQIGRHGQLMEWSSDFIENDPEHRHISHLYGFFPGHDALTRDKKLTAAVRKSLVRRGNRGMGWAMGWKLCIWARLGEPDQFMDQLQTAVRPPCIADNLFDIGPPFQIDANFGIARGITECLIQDHDGEIVLLPALPKEWSEGSVRGIKVKGNHEIDMEWKDGKLTAATLYSISGKTLIARYKDCRKIIHPKSRQKADLYSILK